MKKIKTEPMNTLSTWFLKAPMKFAGLALGGTIAVVAIMTLISMLFSTPEVPVPTFLGLIVVVAILAVMGYSIYKLIKFTPNDSLDRKSFVGIDIGITAITILIYALSMLGLVWAFGFGNLQQFIMYFAFTVNMLVQTNPVIFCAIMLIVFFIAMYMVGLIISKYIIIYRRGRSLGVSKLRLWLSFPFGMQLLWLPGFFLPEDKKAKTAVSFKAKWFSDFTNWVIAKPINAIIFWIVIIGFTVAVTFMFDGSLHNLYLQLFFLILFLGPLLVLGAGKLKKAIPGWFSVIAVVVNILLIVCAIYYCVTMYENRMHQQYASPEVQTVDGTFIQGNTPEYVE